MNTLKTDELMLKLRDELNLDDFDETNTLLIDLLTQSEAIVLDSTNYKNYEQVSDKDIFTRAVFTLATQLYYDRTLSEGLSKGLQMMLNHLQAGAVKDEEK